MDLDNNKTEQQIEEEIINAYLNQLYADTPDLWDRIETGLDAYEDRNIEQIEHVKQKNKKKKNNYVAWITTAVSLAAVLLAAILVIPYLTGDQRNMSVSDMDTNGATSKDQAGFSDIDSAVAGDAYQSDAVESVQENDEYGDAFEEAAQDNSFTQSVSCTLKVIDETDKGYHCEIISINENPYDLSEGMEIDVVNTQGTLQEIVDMTVQVKILSKEEAGYYIVSVK